MLKEEDYIKFIASLPSIQSAIQISGDGNGARVKLEVPQSEMESILRLQKLSGEIFEIIVIPLDKKVINKKIKFLKDSEDASSETNSSQGIGGESREETAK